MTCVWLDLMLTEGRMPLYSGCNLCEPHWDLSRSTSQRGLYCCLFEELLQKFLEESWMIIERQTDRSVWPVLLRSSLTGWYTTTQCCLVLAFFKKTYFVFCRRNKSYCFGMTWGCENSVHMLVFGWYISLTQCQEEFDILFFICGVSSIEIPLLNV